MYVLLRAVAGVALRWFYRDIQVEGQERIPRQGPLLLVVNHPNALVDALLVAWVVPRRVLITAKSTLFTNPIADRLLRWLGVVPLRRASDEQATASAGLDPSRNRDTFRAVHEALGKGATVLVFPEGKSHDEPSLAPLKTGAARMALHARDAGDVENLIIVPIGLTFERKDAPRTRVLVQVGEPIRMRDWEAPSGASEADTLTREIDARLRAVTANYASADDAARSVRLVSGVAGLLDPVSRISAVDRTLGVDWAIARRIDEIVGSLDRATPSLRARADHLAQRLDDVQRLAAQHEILLEDVDLSIAPGAAARFISREGWLLALGGPIALWGRLNHWLPFRAARVVARRRVDSAADPAMRTLVAGVAFVVLAYLVQTAIVMWEWGAITGALYLLSLPAAAEINLHLSDRLRRAARRAHTFLLFRRNPRLHAQFRNDVAALRRDVVELDGELREEARRLIGR